MKILKRSISLIAVIIILSLSLLTCFAKGATVVDNEITVGYKDTFTYTFCLSNCEKPVIDMMAHLYYDSAYLQLDEDSVSFHNLTGVNSNTSIDGQIHFSFSAMSEPVDFSKKTPVISADFKVIKEGKTDIQYFVTDLDCGTADKSQPVKKFKFTCDYVVHSTDGDETYKNHTPVLLSDKTQMDENQGGFINYADGKGEQVKSDKKTDSKKHIAVTGETTTQSEVLEVTKDDDSKNNNMTIIITVAIIVLVLIIAIIGVLRRVFGSESQKVETTDKEEVDENE